MPVQINPEPEYPLVNIVVWFVFNDLRCEVVVRFVDNHWLNFLFNTSRNIVEDGMALNTRDPS